MRVLSLFDGISGAYLALKQAGFDIDKYYASEIDEKAIAVSIKHCKPYDFIGDVLTTNFSIFKDIDLLIGGSPCQDLSAARGSGEGLKGLKSRLFWSFVEALDTINPKYFVLENVGSMSRKDRDIITAALGVSPLYINSKLYSPQARKRYYWTNIDVASVHYTLNTQVLSDVLEQGKMDDVVVSSKLLEVYKLLKPGEYWKHLPDDHPEKLHILETRKKHKNPGGQTGFWKVYDTEEKSPTITASGIKQRMTRFVFIDKQGRYRYPTPIECERLQGVPDNYTYGFTNNQRYFLLGNGFNIPTVAHILRGMK